MGFLKEFKEFLNEYKVMALAVAFIIGIAAADLIQSLVNNIIMPVIASFIPGGAWEEATFSLGPAMIRWGAFVSSVINFLIIALVVFMVARRVMKQEKAGDI